MRVGIVGYGLAGRSFHAPLLKGCGFEVAAILTSNVTRIRQAKEDFPLVKIVTSMQELLSNNLDLVVIASVNLAHCDQALTAIAAGVPVVIDKPFARTVAETEKIFSAAHSADVPVTAFYNRLWDSDTLTVRKAVSNGLIGKPFRFDSRYERFRPTIASTSWRESESPENGGGVLLDLQTHLLSIAFSLFGPADLKYANIRDIRGNTEDDVVLNLSHDSGVDSYLAVSAIAGAPGPRIRILGSKGALVIADVDPQEPLLRAGKYPEGGTWSVPTASKVFLHRGESIEEIAGENGNYGHFYLAIKGAITGDNLWPVSEDHIMQVATTIDKAREISVR